MSTPPIAGKAGIFPGVVGGEAHRLIRGTETHVLSPAHRGCGKLLAHPGGDGQNWHKVEELRVCERLSQIARSEKFGC